MREQIETKCKDCGADFYITGSEQEFYESKGFDLPKRCMSCRAARKANANNQSEKHMSDDEFNQMLYNAFNQ